MVWYWLLENKFSQGFDLERCRLLINLYKESLGLCGHFFRNECFCLWNSRVSVYPFYFCKNVLYKCPTQQVCPDVRPLSRSAFFSTFWPFVVFPPGSIRSWFRWSIRHGRLLVSTERFLKSLLFDVHKYRNINSILSVSDGDGRVTVKVFSRCSLFLTSNRDFLVFSSFEKSSILPLWGMFTHLHRVIPDVMFLFLILCGKSFGVSFEVRNKLCVFL